MGSGLSLNDVQVAKIIERDLKKIYEAEQSYLPRYTDEGYEIFRDFSEEVKLNNKIKQIKEFIKKHPQHFDFDFDFDLNLNLNLNSTKK
jgi:hypothetical protein